MTLCLKEMKSEVEVNGLYRRLQGHSAEYRANILLIASNSLHLWGL